MRGATTTTSFGSSCSAIFKSARLPFSTASSTAQNTQASASTSDAKLSPVAGTVFACNCGTPKGSSVFKEFPITILRVNFATFRGERSTTGIRHYQPGFLRRYKTVLDKGSRVTRRNRSTDGLDRQQIRPEGVEGSHHLRSHHLCQ